MCWMIFAWCLFVGVAAVTVFSKKFRSYTMGLTAFLLTLAVIPCLPASGSPLRTQPVKQIVYQFDDYRHLELVGHACEGAIYYVDRKRRIRTSYMEQFARVFLPPIVHADNDGDFIFLPLDDASSVAVSRDHGRTFKYARWVGGRYFDVREIDAVTIWKRQAYVTLKDGRLFMTSKPFGDRWGLDIIEVHDQLPATTLAERPQFQDLEKSVPEIEGYRGWSEMRCDPDLKGEPIETAGTRWNRFQRQVSDVLARTIALPVTWAVEYFG